MARGKWLLLLSLAVGMPAMALRAQEINWQEAVTRLTQERTRAETCVGWLKKYGDAAAKDRGVLAYNEAKSEYDGVIGGLVVALARKAQPESLPELQARLQRGFDEREAFCRGALALVPRSGGEKGPIAEVVTGIAKPVIDGLVAIWSRVRDDDALMRKTIQTQLEAASWLSFDKVSPLP